MKRELLAWDKLPNSWTKIAVYPVLSHHLRLC